MPAPASLHSELDAAFDAQAKAVADDSAATAADQAAVAAHAAASASDTAAVAASNQFVADFKSTLTPAPAAPSGNPPAAA